MPVLHRWQIVCHEPGLRVDEQVACVVARLELHLEAIAALARELDAEDGGGPGAVLEVVREFNDVHDQNGLGGANPGMIGPPRLGWHLGRRVLDFLCATRAVLDVDEYDHGPDPSDD